MISIEMSMSTVCFLVFGIMSHLLNLSACCLCVLGRGCVPGHGCQ